MLLSACAVLPGMAAAQAEVTVAEAGDPQLERLEALADELGSDDEAVRRSAAAGLRGLGTEMLPAIRARVARLSRGRPPANWVDDLMHRFHRHAPSVDDEPGDLVEGALIELGQPHPRRHEHGYAVKLVETLLLFRALQAMGTHEANVAALPIVGFDEGKWTAEARNWVRREQNHVLAATLAGRSHSDPRVRRWARWAVEELGADDPGRVLPELEDPFLTDAIRAYAGLRMQSAMRVIVSYTDSERRGVRRAAREAIAQYGGNAIWILRTAYRNRVGEHPPREWGWQRVATELYARADEARLGEARTALAAGSEARAAGDLEEMGRRYDRVLAESPDIDEAPVIAEGYAALGDAMLEEGRFEEATTAYRRALRLAPEHARGDAWRAGIQFGEAETLRAEGVLDLHAYEGVRVLAGDEGTGGVVGEAATRVVSSAASAPVTRLGPNRVRFAFGAAALLGLLGIGLLWRGSSTKASLSDPAHAATLDAVTVDSTSDGRLDDSIGPSEIPDCDGPDYPAAVFDLSDATLADSTLPG
ncbi:MAG: tetratricopeptide repeat protein [Sandaracinaceae bacterium]